MKNSALRVVYASGILCILLLVTSCRKKQEDCWECMGKAKADCKSSVKCKWEPNISFDLLWAANGISNYQVVDRGRCMCQQDQIPIVDKPVNSISTIPFYSIGNVTQIAVDKNNVVWISHDQVTDYYNGTTWSPNNIQPSDNITNPHGPYSAVAIASNSFSVSPGNILFSSTETYGMASLNAVSETNPWSYYQTINTSIPTQNLNDVYAETDNRVWIATKDNGLLKFDMPNTFTIYNASNSYIGSNNISSVTADRDGNIWTGSDAGIAKLMSGVFTGYLIGKVNDVACDGQNNIWAATNDGVKKYNIATNTMEYFGTENSGIGSDVVHCLTVDHNGKIWIGTDNGLYTYETSRIVKYTPANASQVGQTIHCMSVDLNNRLWMATNNGVAVLAL